MNLKQPQMRARLEAPDETTRLYLLHGPDEAGALDLAGRLARALGHGAERVDLDGAALKGNPGRLADEAASMSLFGDRRFIRVTGVGEESLEAFTLLLAAERAGNPVVAIGPALRKTGKVVKLVDAAANAAGCACYPPEGREATQLAVTMARDEGLRLNAAAGERLVAASGGDRAVLAREIEKLALFVDATPERPVEADMAAINAVAAVLDESAMFAAIEAVVGGDPRTAGAELGGVIDDNMAIPMLRQLVRRLLTLAEMRGAIDDGGSAETVVKRHRVFWKEEAATLRALRRWSSPQLARAIERLREAERAIVAPANAGPLLAGAEALAVARAAARFA